MPTNGSMSSRCEAPALREFPAHLLSVCILQLQEAGINWAVPFHSGNGWSSWQEQEALCAP